MDGSVLKPDVASVDKPVDNSDFSVNNIVNSSQDLNFISLQGFLGINNPTTEEKDGMNYIIEFFSQNGAKNMSDILLSIKGIENRLGITPIGQSRISALKNYLKISSTIAELKRQQEAMER